MLAELANEAVFEVLPHYGLHCNNELACLPDSLQPLPQS